MGRKWGGAPPPFAGGSKHNVAWNEAHLRAKCHLDPSSRLATIDMGRKLGGSAPFLGKGAGSPSNTKWLGPSRTSISSGILIHAAIWPQQTWPKMGAPSPFWGGGGRSASNTMWTGPRTTCIPSLILIHPTALPQYTNVTEGQTNRQTGQRSDSIRRTVLQNGRPKTGRPMLSDRYLVCLSCLSHLSVTMLYCIVAKRFNGSR